MNQEIVCNTEIFIAFYFDSRIQAQLKKEEQEAIIPHFISVNTKVL